MLSKSINMKMKTEDLRQSGKKRICGQKSDKILCFSNTNILKLRARATPVTSTSHVVATPVILF
jgi:hypothetical protein